MRETALVVVSRQVLQAHPLRVFRVKYFGRSCCLTVLEEAQRVELRSYLSKALFHLLGDRSGGQEPSVWRLG